jgi:hypothetical protein
MLPNDKHPRLGYDDGGVYACGLGFLSAFDFLRFIAFLH